MYKTINEDLKEIKDEDILQRSIDSPSVFEEIVNRYQSAFLRKARALIGDREDINDVVQETFTKIYFNAGRFKIQDGATFSSWAYKILINTTFSHYRKFKRNEDRFANFETELLENFPDLSISDIEREELRDTVVRVLSNLPKKLSRVLTMQFLQGLSQKEIADKEGVSVNAIKTRVHRAKKEFKKEANFIKI
jgi:RNA polymerase sigma-70 factor, ECF subfamily